MKFEVAGVDGQTLQRERCRGSLRRRIDHRDFPHSWDRQFGRNQIDVEYWVGVDVIILVDINYHVDALVLLLHQVAVAWTWSAELGRPNVSAVFDDGRAWSGAPRSSGSPRQARNTPQRTVGQRSESTEYPTRVL